MNPETGYIDYDKLQENARLFHPKLIIAGPLVRTHTVHADLLLIDFHTLKNKSMKWGVYIQRLGVFSFSRNKLLFPQPWLRPHEADR